MMLPCRAPRVPMPRESMIAVNPSTVTEPVPVRATQPGYALSRSRAVRASAGTGKTYTLVETYVGLLAGLERSEPLRPPAILALTFTDRAAGEMRDRIIRRLRAICSPRPERDAWLQSMGDRARLTDAEALARLEPQVLAAPIGTFHSFCGRLLREYAADGALPLSPTILDGPASASLLAESALEAVQWEMDGPDRANVLMLVENLGLGSRHGLLHALVSVPSKLGERGLSLEDLVLVPGSVSHAWVESGTRLPRLLRELARRANTPAARARAALLVQHAAAMEQAGTDEDSLLHVMVDAFRACAGNWGGRELAEPRRQVKLAVQEAASAWASNQAGKVGQQLRGLMASTMQVYQRRKRELCAVDFSDLLMGAADLLRNHPQVRARAASRFEVILVDEMQDTSPVQAQLLMLLTDARATPPASIRDAEFPPGKVLLVGDGKQSIYGFRGADRSLFDDALDALTRSGGEEVILQHSRRSSARLVQLLNELSVAALGHDFTDEDRLVAVAAGGLARPGRWVRAEVSASLDGRERRALEAAALASEIARLLAGDPDGPDRLLPSEIAVLLRTRTHAEVYRRALAAAGIPARIGRGGSLLDRPEIHDVMALLALVADRDDSAALACVLRSPFVLLRDEVILAACLKREPPRLDVGALLRVKEEDGHLGMTVDEVEAWTRLENVLIPLWPRANRLDATAVLTHVLDALDGWAVLELHDDGSARVANVRALLSRLRGSSVGEAVGLVEEARRANVVWPLGTPEGATQQVTLLTIHEAKGLEYRVAALADLCGRVTARCGEVEWHPRVGMAVRNVEHSSGILEECKPPTPMDEVRDAQEQDAEAEAKRLLYVALTRAKEMVLFSGEPRKGCAPSTGTFAMRLYPVLERLVRQGLVQVRCAAPVTAPANRQAEIALQAIIGANTDDEGLPRDMDSVEAVALADAMVCARRFAYLWREPERTEPIRGDDGVPPELMEAVRRMHLLADPSALKAGAGDEVVRALRLASVDEGRLTSAALTRLEAQVKGLWNSPLGQALEQVPSGFLWRCVPGVVDVQGIQVHAAPDLVVAGTRGEPWMVLSCQQERGEQVQAYHQALLDLWALIVARATGASTVRAVLAYVHHEAPRMLVRTLTQEHLDGIRSHAEMMVSLLPGITQESMPPVLPRTECVERGCAFLHVCHPEP